MVPATQARMAKQNRNPEEQKPLSTTKKLQDLYELIDGIEIAMLTTRTADGSLVSRPMQTQARRAGTDLWFMTVTGSGKLEELDFDPHVNLAYYKDGTREFVSVSGRARMVQDRGVIRQLYKPDWKAWLGDEGGERDGGPDDPRIALIEVQADSAAYLKSNEPRLISLFKVGKAIATGNPPDVGDAGKLDADELAMGQARSSH
jgi:general stress protein 26